MEASLVHSTKLVLYGWGANNYGQLGLGHSEDVSVPTPIDFPSSCQEKIDQSDPVAGSSLTIKSIHGGGGFSLILTDDGSLYGCGSNSKGQLTFEHKDNVSSFTLCKNVVSKLQRVSAGWDFVLAVTGDNEVISWGSNSFGQLGRDLSSGSSNDCKPGKIYIGDDFRIVDIAAGMRHGIVALDDGSVCTWGHGKKAQLGVILTTGKSFSVVPVEVCMGSKKNKIVRVIAGMYHSGCLDASGNVFMWGCNKFGQCGISPESTSSVTTPTKVNIPDYKDRIVSLVSGWTHVMAKTESGCILNWGRCDLCQLGRTSGEHKCESIPAMIPDFKRIKSFSCGTEHCLACTESNELYAWGWNEHSICGTGDEVNVEKPRRVETLSKHTVLQIGSGAGHSFCVAECRS